MCPIWPHTCHAPGDGATVLPTRHPATLPQHRPVPLHWWTTRHSEGASILDVLCPGMAVYEANKARYVDTEWELYGAWMGCPCHQGRVTG